MAELILGPVLRYVSETEATVWVETDRSCEVEVLGRRERTFCVDNHHYALVVLRDLEPGARYEYGVALDGEPRWHPRSMGFPASTIRTLHRERPLKVVFGSCRVAVPHRPPYTLTKDEDPEHGREIDALYALATRMRKLPPEQWPHVLLSLGDQIYADEDAPRTREFIRSRRDTGEPPHEQVLDFQEYTRLYWESWGEPAIRWLLSTVSTAMVYDDHDVHDDWNTSEAWVEEMRAQPWWETRIESALASYWIYQHIGNLSPKALEANELLTRVKAAQDAGPILFEFARKADNETNGSRWSFCRDLGRTRLLVFDSREGRVLSGRRRKMIDDGEWHWLEQHVRGDFDHLLLADSLPILLPPGLHHLEAWSERVCAGAWGEALAPVGERIRRALDLEHWAAFSDSFERVTRLMRDVGAGRHGRPPATIMALAGDVHHAYLADVAFRRDANVRSAVYQAVCSPFRNALDVRERMVVRLATLRPLGRAVRALARIAGVADPEIRWRLAQSPTFDNQFGTLDIDGRSLAFRIEKILPGNWREPEIEISLERDLA